MSGNDLEANKALTRQFVDTLVRHDYAAMEKLLHPDFVWNTAVTGDSDPNALKPLQSKFLAGKNLPHAKPRLNRTESLAVFKTMFEGQYDGAMESDTGPKMTKESAKVVDEKHRLKMWITSLTAEDDRVAMEAESDILHPTNGRTYHNYYHHVFRVRDGKILLFKEYQDTLHLFDFITE